MNYAKKCNYKEQGKHTTLIAKDQLLMQSLFTNQK